MAKDFSIFATDLAEIHTELVSEEAIKAARLKVQFLGGIPCERQPFDDNSFDLVTSQFGFEYSDIATTLKEVRRILAPDGRFIAISHHQESLLIKASGVELEIYALAIDKLNLVGATRRYFEALGELNGDPKLFKKASKRAKPESDRINEVMNEFRSRHGEHECGKLIVGAISFIAGSTKYTSLDDRLQALDTADSDFKMARARLDDMVAAALSQDDIDELSLQSRTAGFESAHCLKLFDEMAGLAGWQIHLR